VENERARIGRGGSGPVVFGETKEDAGAISDLPGSFGKGTGLTNRRRLPSALAAGMTRPLQSGRHPRAASWDSPSRTMGLRRPLTVLLALVVLGGIYVAVQALRGAPRPSLVEGAQVGFTIPGAPPVLPWPSTGESEVQVEGVGTFGPVGETTPVAMGSVAKIMAAYVILHDHPLALGQQGPSIPITTADVAIYNADLSQGDSVVPVTAGQSFTELQALQALLVPSGDNIAELLATWDTGSEAAFVAKMNAEAASLGMSHTHYADVSGISSGTVSTAADQLILAPLAMANATFAATVGLTQIDLPSGGLLTNYNSLLGTDGIDGIKTGSVTSGDLVFSAKHTVGGHTETIYGAVLGVIPAPGQGDIPAATSAGQLLVKAVEADVAPVRVLAQGTVEAHVSAPWLGAPVPVSTDKAVTALGWPGLTVKVSASPSGKLARSIPSGAGVGRATVEVGSQRSVVALRTTGPIPGPSLGWRLTRL
jgi:D-alanyl-D-alanine carboxypeptidase (penicillin-binding protein 5/6)